MEFLTVENAVSETEIKRSRFICQAKYCESEQAAKAFIADVKKQNALATHNCYAYSVLDGGVLRERYSDDGEPQGTAGLPILSVIKNKGYKCLACVVTRFFGGIKLGTGGLVRAYSEACKIALECAPTVTYALCAQFKAELDYENYKKFSLVKTGDYAFLKAPVYAEKVEQMVFVKEERASEFLSDFDGVFCKRQSIERLSSVIVKFPQ